jgi:hypothetical protein
MACGASSGKNAAVPIPLAGAQFGTITRIIGRQNLKSIGIPMSYWFFPARCWLSSK